VGVLEKLGIRPQRAATATLPPLGSKTRLSILSPFQEQSILPQLVAMDIFGPGVELPLSRLVAMQIPAVVKARAILHSLIATRPLVAYRGEDRLDPQPTWLYRSDTGIDPAMRLRDIIDDLFFNEAALLAVQRTEAGSILDAVHIPYDRWAVDTDGRILVDNKPAPTGSVIWIPGPWAGLLVHGQATIRAAIQMDDAWRARVRNPFPAMTITPTDNIEVTEGERQDLIKAVSAARRDIDNAVMFVPYGLKIEEHAISKTDLFESGRNAVRLDFANLLNMPAALLDGSVSEASLTYSTQEGRRNELFDYTIGYWTAPIEQALSQDEVVPRGQRVRIDFTDYLTPAAAPTGPIEQD
jgi:hypothetical protein